MSERLRRGTLAALVTVVALLTPATSGLAQNVPLERGAFAGSVGVGGGRSLYLECHGHGSPSVILEAGLRSRSDFWSERTEETRGTTVLPGVARYTRVCAYDARGLRSEPTPSAAATPCPCPALLATS